jgi:hypothetical protein
MTSNRIFDPAIKEPIEAFAKRARIKGVEFVPANGGVRLRAAQKHYPWLIRAVDAIDAASAALERELARHEAAMERIGDLEDKDLGAIAKAAIESRKRPRRPMQRAA